MRTIVGLFDYASDAHAAVDDLLALGLARDQISVISRDIEARYAEDMGAHDAVETTPEEVAAGAAVGGGILGGVLGLLIGAGALVIPGVGPVVAAGPVVAGLAGAGVGAAAGGLLGGLIGWGIPEEEAEVYAEAVRRGGVLVAAEVPDADAAEAKAVMERHYPVDVDERAALWREEGWERFDASAEPLTAEELAAQRRRDRGWMVDEEQYRSERPQLREHFLETYDRAGEPYDRYEPAYHFGYELASDPRLRRANWEQVLPVARRRWEEMHPDMSWNAFSDAIHYTWDKISRSYREEPYGEADYTWETFAPGFREHYEVNYAGSGQPYETYESAYRFGYTLATQPQYRQHTWRDVEQHASRGWEVRKGQSWDDVRNAVRHAWSEVRARDRK